MKYCINCGSEVNNESKFCGNCGGNLEKAREYFVDKDSDINKNNDEKAINNIQKMSIDYTRIDDLMKKDISEAYKLPRLGLFFVIAVLLVGFYSYYVLLNDISGIWKAENEAFKFELTIDEEKGHLSIIERNVGYNKRVALFPVTVEKSEGNSFNLDINGRKYRIVKSIGNSFIMEFNGVYTQTGWVFEEVKFVRE